MDLPSARTGVVLHVGKVECVICGDFKDMKQSLLHHYFTQVRLAVVAVEQLQLQVQT